jgi:hypothetical protein
VVTSPIAGEREKVLRPVLVDATVGDLVQRHVEVLPMANLHTEAPTKEHGDQVSHEKKHV